MTAMTGQPIYEQIADDLRKRIERGSYAVGQPLPSTTKLMAEYRASITAVRAAVGLLKQEGIVRGQAGKGVYVQQKPDVTAATDLRSRVDELAQALETLTARVVELERSRRTG